MLAILFVVFWVLGAVLYPYPGAPWSAWPFTSHILYMLLFALLGLAVFGLAVRL